ncbi:MAG TPA: hypothetical protein VEJ41_08300 [Candidatus Acidoferrales bacterium]|nr:hypothetical protein [Candidatus Acidoferrales bacterium]
MQWRNIGPAIAGGRVAAVAGTNADPYLYYFGAAGGGVWRTTNGGVTWVDVFAKQPTASIGALAIAPSDKNIVWVGTGESKPRNDISLGDGVWSSVDGGTTWQHAGIDSPSIARILIDRRNPNVVLVGALGDPYRDSSDRGVYRTTDGGKTWSQTLYVGPQSGACDLAWDPNGNRLVFAGIWQVRRVPWTFTSGGPQDGLYRSRDGGISWQRLSGHGLPQGIMGRIGVAVAPSDPKRVYALIQSKEGSLWRSDDAGDTWRLVSKDSYINQRPFYMSRLEVDPKDPNHVFFLSEDLIESHDGGKTIFNNVNAVHQDHHGMWIAADGKRIIEGNDGGAPISLDAGATWDWRYNVTIGQIYHVGVDSAIPYNVCGGLQDNDSYCGPSDSLNPLGISNHDWTDVGNDSDGSWAWPDPLDPRFVWNVGVNVSNGQLNIYDRRTRESFDVTPYVHDTTGAPLAGLPYRFDWEAPFAFSRVHPGVAYYGGNVVWKTLDRGRHWTQISPDLTLDDPAHQQVAGGPINTDVSGAEFYDTILDIAPSPRDGGVIWVGTDDGLVQLTRDGGAHWSNVTPQVGAYGRVETVEASPFDAGAAFAVVDRRLMGDRAPYVFRTSDYGAHWTSMSGDLPSSETMHVVRQDLRNPSVFYAGSESGVWVSLDAGAHWMRSPNLPTVAVYDMRVQPQANDLVIATHGRGFWILDDLTPIEALAAASAPAPIFFQPRVTYAYFRWWAHEYGSGVGECCAPQDTFAGENPPAGALLSYYLPARVQPHSIGIQVDDEDGDLIAHVTASGNAGINRVAWGLADDPPVSWLSAPAWNQGFDEGAPVIPGTYKVTLRLEGTTFTQLLTVKADPRAQWTQADYVARRAFLRKLYARFSRIDIVLNDLDATRAALYKKVVALRSSGGNPAVLARDEQLLLQAQALSAQISSNPRNSEDPLWHPDQLREHLQALIAAYSGLSQGPPLAPHYADAAAIGVQYDALMSRYEAFTSQLHRDDAYSPR